MVSFWTNFEEETSMQAKAYLDKSDIFTVKVQVSLNDTKSRSRQALVLNY